MKRKPNVQEQIEANCEAMLAAAGNPKLRLYMPGTQERIRNAMREIMSASYIAGSNACFTTLKEGPHDEVYDAGVKWLDSL